MSVTNAFTAAPPPAVVAPPSPAASVRLKPVYYRRAADGLPGDGTDSSDTPLPPPPPVPESHYRRSSGVLMVRKDSHHHVEGNVELIRDLARQRNGLLLCAVAFLALLTVLVSTWGILKHLTIKSM